MVQVANIINTDNEEVPNHGNSNTNFLETERNVYCDVFKFIF